MDEIEKQFRNETGTEQPYSADIKAVLKYCQDYINWLKSKIKNFGERSEPHHPLLSDVDADKGLVEFNSSFNLWKDDDGDYHAIFTEKDYDGNTIKKYSVEICCTSGGNNEIYETLERLNSLIQLHGFKI